MDSNILKQRARAFNYLFDAVVVTDVQGIITDWNKGSENLYGYSKEDVIGKPVSILHVPEDVEHVTSEVIASIEKYSRWSGEVRMLHKDGHIGWIESVCVPIIDDNNQMVGALGINRDITKSKNAEDALRESEHRFRSLVETTGDWIWAINLEGIHTYSNPVIKNILGYEPEEIVGKSSFSLLHEEDLIKVEKALTTLPKAKTGWSGWVLRWRHKDGTYKYLESNAVPILDDSDEVVGFQGTDRDITERMHTEDQLRRSQKMEALGKLTGGIAHDFNNMLGVILGYSELLEDKLADTPQLSKYIKQISSAGNRAKKLTSKLLAFSRKQPSDKKSSNINCLLERDRHMLEKTLTAKIDLTIEMAKELWDVCLDEEMLGDSILNVCINSMHAMPDGGKLTISTKNAHLDDSEVQSFSIPAGDFVQLSITDTGTGISPDIKEKIFEPFFTTKGDAGTGLGLSQVYGFVKQSNGEIQIFSEPGKGAQIVIYIPKYLKQKTDGCCITKSSETTTTSKNEIILVVDDEPALRTLAEEILESRNYQVWCAGSGEEALKILATKDIDLMLTDIIMPNMDGYQLASQVKQQFPEIKILIASGYNEQLKNEDSENTLYPQIDKPYSFDALLKGIRKLLDE